MRRNRRGLLSMLLGLLLVLAAVGLALYNVWDGDRAETAAAEALVQLEAQMPQPEAVANRPAELIPNYVLDPQREMPVIEVEHQDFSGCIDIPELRLRLPVMDRWSYPNLDTAPCRFAGNVYQDDLIIAGHNYRRHFGGLRNLRTGDLVRFTDVEGNIFPFEVTEMIQLAPTQIDELLDGDWDLTLFTCTVGGQNRLVIRCAKAEPIQ